MKHLVSYVFFCLIGLTCSPLFSQTIDLNTGINDNNGLPFANGVNDDTWEATWYNGTPAGPWFPTIVGYGYTFANQDPAVKWVQFGYVGNPNWNQMTTPNPWTSYVRTTFYVASCNIQSAKIEFDQIGADDSMDQIIVNNNPPHQVNFSFGPTPTTNNTMTNNVTINLGNEITQGWNTIMFRVHDMSGGGGSSHGILVHGRIKVQSTSYLDFKLGDENGISKSEFCMGEGVFMNASGAGATAPLYYLTLYDITGGGSTLLSWSYSSGTPIGVNIINQFQTSGSPSVTFQAGKKYRVKLFVNSPCNLETYKDFTLKCCDTPAFDLKDANGNIKTEFCMGDKIFMHGTGGSATGSYGLELYDVTGGGSSLLSSIPSNTGAPVGVNITDKFQTATTPVIFQDNKTYRVKLKVNGPCSLEVYKDFTYICCDHSVDASFWASTSSGALQAQGTGMGNHVWSIYSVPQVSNGNYVWIQNYYTPSFSFTGINNEHCYYVVHTLTNSCGMACSAQTVCKSECGDKQCNLSKPGNLMSGQGTNNLVWSPVPGALYYTVEINPYDSRCCEEDPGVPPLPGGPPPTTGSYPSKYFNVYTGHSFVWDPQLIFNFEGAPPTELFCFSWRVIAHCPDGGTTYSNYSCSWDDGTTPPPNDPPGFMGNTGSNDGTVNYIEDADHVKSKDAGIKSKAQVPSTTEVMLYPNPSKGNVTVDLSTASDVEFSIHIYDISGKMIRMYEHLKTSNRKANVKVQDNLTKGAYLVKIITSDQQVIDKKLIIE